MEFDIVLRTTFEEKVIGRMSFNELALPKIGNIIKLNNEEYEVINTVFQDIAGTTHTYVLVGKRIDNNFIA